MSLAVDAAEARYRQVEASFESAVKQVKAQGVANEQLDALLSRMQTDLKHSLLRAHHLVGSFAFHASTPTPNDGSMTTLAPSATLTPLIATVGAGGITTPAAINISLVLM